MASLSYHNLHHLQFFFIKCTIFCIIHYKRNPDQPSVTSVVRACKWFFLLSFFFFFELLHKFLYDCIYCPPPFQSSLLFISLLKTNKSTTNCTSSLYSFFFAPPPFCIQKSQMFYYRKNKFFPPCHRICYSFPRESIDGVGCQVNSKMDFFLVKLTKFS